MQIRNSQFQKECMQLMPEDILKPGKGALEAGSFSRFECAYCGAGTDDLPLAHGSTFTSSYFFVPSPSCSASSIWICIGRGLSPARTSSTGFSFMSSAADWGRGKAVRNTCSREVDLGHIDLARLAIFDGAVLAKDYGLI